MKPMCRMCQHFHMEPTEPDNYCRLKNSYMYHRSVCDEFLPPPHADGVIWEAPGEPRSNPHRKAE